MGTSGQRSSSHGSRIAALDGWARSSAAPPPPARAGRRGSRSRCRRRPGLPRSRSPSPSTSPPAVRRVTGSSPPGGRGLAGVRSHTSGAVKPPKDCATRPGRAGRRARRGRRPRTWPEEAESSSAGRSGASASWPRARSSATTRCQYQPPSPAPWISANVAMVPLHPLTVRAGDAGPPQATSVTGSTGRRSSWSSSADASDRARPLRVPDLLRLQGIGVPVAGEHEVLVPRPRRRAPSGRLAHRARCAVRAPSHELRSASPEAARPGHGPRRRGGVGRPGRDPVRSRRRGLRRDAPREPVAQRGHVRGVRDGPRGPARVEARPTVVRGGGGRPQRRQVAVQGIRDEEGPRRSARP